MAPARTIVSSYIGYRCRVYPCHAKPQLSSFGPSSVSLPSALGTLVAPKEWRFQFFFFCLRVLERPHPGSTDTSPPRRSRTCGSMSEGGSSAEGRPTLDHREYHPPCQRRDAVVEAADPGRGVAAGLRVGAATGTRGPG